MSFQELADCMAGDKRIGPAEALQLSGLIENEHPGVMHAYRDYVHSQVRQQILAARAPLPLHTGIGRNISRYLPQVLLYVHTSYGSKC